MHTFILDENLTIGEILSTLQEDVDTLDDVKINSDLTKLNKDLEKERNKLKSMQVNVDKMDRLTQTSAKTLTERFKQVKINSPTDINEFAKLFNKTVMEITITIVNDLKGVTTTEGYKEALFLVIASYIASSILYVLVGLLAGFFKIKSLGVLALLIVPLSNQLTHKVAIDSNIEREFLNMKNMGSFLKFVPNLLFNPLWSLGLKLTAFTVATMVPRVTLSIQKSTAKKLDDGKTNIMAILISTLLDLNINILLKVVKNKQTREGLEKFMSGAIDNLNLLSKFFT